MTRLRCAAFALLLLGSTPTHASPPTSKDPSVTVKGVGLGSTPSAIRAALGKPTKEVTLAADSVMGMGKMREVHYPGLVFELCRPPGKSDFYVWRFTVTRPGYVVAPGLSVGMKADDARRIFGPPGSTAREPVSGRETLHYSFTAFDGWYWVYVLEDKVVEIGAAEDWT